MVWLTAYTADTAGLKATKHLLIVHEQCLFLRPVIGTVDVVPAAYHKDRNYCKENNSLIDFILL